MIKLFLRQITNDYKDELSPGIIYLVFRWIIIWFDLKLVFSSIVHQTLKACWQRDNMFTDFNQDKKGRDWKDKGCFISHGFLEGLGKHFATSLPQVHTLRHQWNVKTINTCIIRVNCFIYFVFNSIPSSRWSNHFLVYILSKTLQMICTSSRINWSDQIGSFINYLVACTL